MPTLLRLLVTIAACFVLAACDEKSVNPLSDPAKAQADPGVAGIWQVVMEANKPPKEVQILHFVPRNDNWSDIVVVVHDGTGTDRVTQGYRMFPTILGKHRFMNVVSTDNPMGKAPRQPGEYNFLRYELSGRDTLKVWTMNSKWALRTVTDGRLRGTVDRSFVTTVKLIDSSENLASVVQESDPIQSFDGELFTLRRVIPPFLPNAYTK